VPLSLHEIFDSSGLRTRYGAAHAVEGRGAFSCGAAWSGVSGTTQRTVTARWVVPLTSLQDSLRTKRFAALRYVRGSVTRSKPAGIKKFV